MADDQAWPGDRGDWYGLNQQLRERINWARRRCYDGHGHYITQVSGNRTYGEQVQLRRQNCGTSDWAIYHMAPMSCSPPTAIPGTSNHEGGDASDLNPGPRDCPQCAPLFAEAGLHFPVPRENWHTEQSPNAGPLPDTPAPEPAPPVEDDMPIPNDSLIIHRDSRIFLVNGVTRLASHIPGDPPGVLEWIKAFYNFAHSVNPASPMLEDHTNDPDTGTALIDFRVVNIVATQ